MAPADTFIEISDDESAPTDEEQWSTPRATADDENEVLADVHDDVQPSRSAPISYT